MFGPALGDLIIHAFGIAGVKRTALKVEHLMDAQRCANLLQASWAGKEVNLWTVDLQTIALVAGTATYNVDPTTVMIMATYITTGSSPPKDRIIISVDRDTYASYPDKTNQSFPTVYWFNKQIAPTITLWPVPDANGPYTLNFYRARQIQDASAVNGLNAEVPYRFLDAYVGELAWRLAQIYKPDRVQELMAYAKGSFDLAAQRDVENAPLKITPALSTYTSSVY